MENPMTALPDLTNYIRLRALTTPCTKARIVILGSKSVGKTSIADWFVQKRKATELRSKKSQQHILMSPDLIMYLIDIDETALPALIKMNIRSADAFVFVYAVDDFYSIEYIRFMRDAIVKIPPMSSSSSSSAIRWSSRSARWIRSSPTAWLP